MRVRKPGRIRARGFARCLVAALSLATLAGSVSEAGADGGGLQRDVVFTDYSPLSVNSELVRRLWSPLAAADGEQILSRSGKALSEQSIDLAEEKFTVYVPSQTPPHGYALLVFVPPWEDARLPRGWASVLDHYGVIFVCAARSGNSEPVYGRREPLALLAAQNVMHRYTVNPDRIYVGGFSGGSRVAMRLALAYPDLFRGALLNAGSDPIGDPLAPLPRKDLFLRFQTASRLVYLTGDGDYGHLGMDADSMQSMRHWCVFDVFGSVSARTGHEVADSVALSRALGALLNPVPRDPNELAACRSDIEEELAAKLHEVESLIAKGKRDDAQKALMETDRRFGGLASPRSSDLESTLN
jgi:pimeloyl-ACP methyl ester carboxylesterase